MGMIWNMEDFENKIALIDEYGTHISYKEFEFMTDSLAKKVGGRCLVFSLCRNEIGSILGYTSFVNNGIVSVQLNTNIDDRLLNVLINRYKPRFLWVPYDQHERFNSYECVYTEYKYVLLRTGFENVYQLNDELALLITTSGSTGSPKFVRQSYANIIENARSISEYLRLDDTERPITTLPMNYVYGLSIINSHFLVGATILVTDKSFMQKEFWEFFKKENATSLGGVPYTYEILDKLRFYRMNLPSLRTMTQAGGKITPELQKKFAIYAKEHNKKFVIMYGAAEATSRMGYLPPEMALEKQGSMGIPIPGGRFKLIDDNGSEISTPLTTGEIVYEGKNVTLGYAERGEDLIKGDERQGKLETGDMAWFDDDGYYYIVGRKKRFLKIYGNRVNLDEIDRLVKGEFEIEVASDGIDDHLYLFITDANLTKKIKDFVVLKTKLNQAAFEVIVIDEIPKNESGKILYKELKKYYAE